MQLLHTYPALAMIGDSPRLKHETVTVLDRTFYVYRNANVYLDSKALCTRYTEDPSKHTYCVEIRVGLLAVLTTASSDEAFGIRLTAVAEWGERAGKRPIDGLDEWIAQALAIADDTEGYTARAKARIAEQRATREVEQARMKAERAERDRIATAERLAANAEAFRAGESIDFGGFEELCGLHGVVMPIRTLGACRRNVSSVSRHSIRVSNGSKPEGIWTAVRTLDAKLKENALEVPHASDCAHWVNEPCDCVTAKDARTIAIDIASAQA